MIVGPILRREVLTSPRRSQHFVLRGSYVALFFVLLWTAWQMLVGFQQVSRLSDLAYFHALIFPVLAYVQLALILFGGSLYGTTAISHEKDRRTFVLLMMTRLPDVEIVLDKFLCGLLQILGVQLASLPVFCMLMLMGGVSPSQLLATQAVTFGAAAVSIALAVLIAVWREKTYQSIALTLVAIVLTLIGIEAFAWAGPTELFGIPREGLAAMVSPFRAIAAVADPRATGGLAGWEHPGWIYPAVTLVCAVLFLVISVTNLRRWNPRGEPIQQPDVDTAGAKRSQRDPFRRIWGNPVLWREIRTRAYGTRGVLIKLGYLLIAAILFAGLFYLRSEEPTRTTDLSIALLTLVLSVVSLLLVNAQAASAVCSERDLRSLDLLLATDLSPREFVFGKLWGAFYNSKEMVLVPLLFLFLAASWTPAGILRLGYAVVWLGVLLLFAAVLGIHAALRYDSTRVSLAHSLGTTFLLSGGVSICLLLIVISGNRFEGQWGSFVLFIVLGSIGLWISLSANHPSNAITLTAAVAPFATLYCLIAYVQGDRFAPFLVGTGVYGFANAALLVPLLSEFDVATGRTSYEDG